jgi:hypothetical protein
MSMKKKEPTYVIDNLTRWELRDIIQALKDYQDFIIEKSPKEYAIDGRWGCLADKVRKEFEAVEGYEP